MDRYGSLLFASAVGFCQGFFCPQVQKKFFFLNMVFDHFGHFSSNINHFEIKSVVTFVPSTGILKVIMKKKNYENVIIIIIFIVSKNSILQNIRYGDIQGDESLTRALRSTLFLNPGVIP